MKKNKLHILLINMSQKFSDKEYDQAKTTLFAMLHGVNYGFNDLSPHFLQVADDIYFEYKPKKNKLIKSQFKKTIKNCNIIQFSDYKKC